MGRNIQSKVMIAQPNMVLHFLSFLFFRAIAFLQIRFSHKIHNLILIFSNQSITYLYNMINCMMSVTTSTVVKIMPNRVKDITLYFSFSHLKTKESHIFLLFISRYFVSTLDIALTFQRISRIFYQSSRGNCRCLALSFFLCHKICLCSIFLRYL